MEAFRSEELLIIVASTVRLLKDRVALGRHFSQGMIYRHFCLFRLCKDTYAIVAFGGKWGKVWLVVFLGGIEIKARYNAKSFGWEP